jgi:hypothetical protein
MPLHAVDSRTRQVTVLPAGGSDSQLIREVARPLPLLPHTDLPHKGDGDRAVLSWFDRNLHRCITLVPSRRRKQFLAGVYEAARVCPRETRAGQDSRKKVAK